MNILIVGGGGREHALAWKVARSNVFESVFIAPGNPGSAQIGENLDIAINDWRAIANAAREHDIKLALFGPEQPLAEGCGDRLRDAGLAVFGPGQKAARLESSKAWAKNFMRKYGVPTADFELADSKERADAYIASHDCDDYVVKADGLAAGKGVVLPDSPHSARAAVDKFFADGHSSVVFERRLTGRECSVFALVCDGVYSDVVAARDYKKLSDGEQGPNTGGMGCYAAPEFWSDELAQRVKDAIFEPTMRGLKAEGLSYRGVLYAGVILGDGGEINLLEFNVRFGDPECQVLTPLLDDDFATTVWQVANGKLVQNHPLAPNGASAAVGVVLASKGYPSEYAIGKPIALNAADNARQFVFHAGTRIAAQNELQTNGGRVLTVVGVGDNLSGARERAYQALRDISFEGMTFRADIAHQNELKSL